MYFSLKMRKSLLPTFQTHTYGATSVTGCTTIDASEVYSNFIHRSLSVDSTCPQRWNERRMIPKWESAREVNIYLLRRARESPTRQCQSIIYGTSAFGKRQEMVEATQSKWFLRLLTHPLVIYLCRYLIATREITNRILWTLLHTNPSMPLSRMAYSSTLSLFYSLR